MKFDGRYDPLGRSRVEIGPKNLHLDFRITGDNQWFYNRDIATLGGKPALKARVVFSDPRLLDDAPFVTTDDSEYVVVKRQ